MTDVVKVCKCGNKLCKGFTLLHTAELTCINSIKESAIDKYGDVEFELMDSPSSGEVFTKFYELHVRDKVVVSIK